MVDEKFTVKKEAQESKVLRGARKVDCGSAKIGQQVLSVRCQGHDLRPLPKRLKTCRIKGLV
jgi:hypothetical protein